ncbi:MAG: hypothetical protein AAB914_03430, partial [Patescibacteria group bacterium]
ERLDKKVDEFYKKRTDTFQSKKNSAELTMNRYTPGSEKNIDTKLPADGKKALKSKISEKKKALSSYNERAKSPEVGDIVLATCSSIFTTAIYGKLVPEVKNQMALDSLSMKNAINSTRYEATDYIYAKNKNNSKVESKLKSAKVASMVKPATNSASIEQVQAKLNSGQDVTGDINNLSASMKKQTTDINGTFKQVTTAVKPAYKRTSSSSSSGGSSNTGGSGGSNNAGSGGSGGSTDTSNKGKKKQKDAKAHSVSGKKCAKSARGKAFCMVFTCESSLTWDCRAKEAAAQKTANQQAANDNTAIWKEKPKKTAKPKKTKEQTKKDKTNADKIFNPFKN